MIENSPELLHTEPFQKCHRVPVLFSHKKDNPNPNPNLELSAAIDVPPWLLSEKTTSELPLSTWYPCLHYIKISLKIPVLCRYKFRLGYTFSHSYFDHSSFLRYNKTKNDRKCEVSITLTSKRRMIEIGMSKNYGKC